MAIAHYPSLHDGATLYLVQLTEGIHVNVRIRIENNPLSFGTSIVQSCRPSTLPSTIPLSSICLPSYVNIHSPSKLSLNSLNKILCKFDQTPSAVVPSLSGYCQPMVNKNVYCQSTGQQFSPSDAPVSSVKWIVDGCTLTFTKPRVNQEPIILRLT